MVRSRLLPRSGAGGKLRAVVSQAGEWALRSVVEDCIVPLTRAQLGPDSSQMWTGSMMPAPANTPVTLLWASSFQLPEVGVAPRSCALSPFQRAGMEMGELLETPNSHVSLPAKGIGSPASIQRTTVYSKAGCSPFSTHSFVRTPSLSEFLGYICGICRS